MTGENEALGGNKPINLSRIQVNLKDSSSKLFHHMTACRQIQATRPREMTSFNDLQHMLNYLVAPWRFLSLCSFFSSNNNISIGRPRVKQSLSALTKINHGYYWSQSPRDRDALPQPLMSRVSSPDCPSQRHATSEKSPWLVWVF